jgi:hypothetical protein
MTSDATGVIWIAGVRAEILQAETSTSLTGIDNPDNVIVDSTNRMRADLDVITIWKISPVGELLATYSSPQTSVALIKSIFVGSNGISLIGQLNGSSFLLTATLTGFFSKIFTLGTDKTSFNDVVRLSDGSSYIFGSSSETLQGKKVAGKTDGLLLTADKNGKFTQLVRSSAPQALRDWQSADSTLVTTGSVRTGKNVETAITQFSKAFKPTWTLRVQSLGTSRVVAANGMTYLAISSQSAITGISGWKPSAPTLLVIAFDAKGVIKAASSFAGLSTPLTLKFTREAGLVGTAVSTGNTVSIFRAGSR